MEEKEREKSSGVGCEEEEDEGGFWGNTNGGSFPNLKPNSIQSMQTHNQKDSKWINQIYKNTFGNQLKTLQSFWLERIE